MDNHTILDFYNTYSFANRRPSKDKHAHLSEEQGNGGADGSAKKSLLIRSNVDPNRSRPLSVMGQQLIPNN